MIVVCTMFSDAYKGIAEVTMPVLERYCERHGYLAAVIQIPDWDFPYRKIKWIRDTMLDKNIKAIFYLDGREYGMDVMDVRMIEKCTFMETVENAPKNMKGKVELRGEVLPIISLRAKFGSQSLKNRLC